MLIGDIIVGMRARGPDPCQTLPPPGLSAPTATTGGVLANGTYFFVVTSVNQWGETLASQEFSIALTGGNTAFQVPIAPIPSAFAIGASSLPTSVRVYLGVASQTYNVYQAFTSGISASFIVTVTGSGLVAGSPPSLNRAFLPDTNGGFVSGVTTYEWLNDALKVAARVTGGIQDAVGVASVSGQRRYVVTLNGQWLRLDQCFYDGWELDLGNKAETFRNRNLTANISISLMVDAASDTTRVELYWTPSRTAGTADTSAGIGATDTTIPINAVSGWLLADGYALLSDGTNNEIISYSAQSATQLTGCIRGWGGTQPFAFADEATVTELNIELNGYRMPYVYSLGQAQVTLGVPPGWEPFLKDYMLGLFREAEQERQEAKDLKDGAIKALAEWAKSNKPVAGPRQCRMYGDYGIRGLVPGGLSGGIVIP